MNKSVFPALILTLQVIFLIPQSVKAQTSTDWWSQNWAMAGANPQRTSWTAQQVPSADYLSAHRNQINNGMLYPEWYKPIEPYIPPKVQIIAAYNTLYISTSKGLFAIDSETGEEKWIYPTELPLGHSPTIYNGVAYVGGFDQKIHAIDALTGQGLWTFQAGNNTELSAGFDTSPLVVNDKLYAGNRDGYMYAIFIDGSNKGQLAWKYKTGGQIHFSAAFFNNTIYFASDDSRAYALNAADGSLIWRSEQLPGEGFHSWWPVVYQDPETGADVVVFAGNHRYRHFVPPRNALGVQWHERDDIFPNHDFTNVYYDTYRGEPRSPRDTTGWIDTSRSHSFADVTTLSNSDYFEQKPYRRTYFVLNRSDGQEVTYDFDHDGTSEYAPILWFGTHGGNRHPPIIGADNLLYQSNMYNYNRYIHQGQVSGWKIGTPFIYTPAVDTVAMDEPVGYSAGGNLVYWNHCCDRSAGAFDLSVPSDGSVPARARSWLYYNYNIRTLIPGYDPMYTEPRRPNDWPGLYGTTNGVYSGHVGDQNAPIPYQGKLYIHRSNTIIAFSPSNNPVHGLPLYTSPSDSPNSAVNANETTLKNKLEEEIAKIIQAGHLRPGWGHGGLFDLPGKQTCGDDLSDYWHNTADTLYALTQAFPHVSPALQSQLKTYLKNEFENYPPYTYIHNGWKDGVSRDDYQLPPEDDAAAATYGPTAYGSSYGFEGWNGPPSPSTRPNYPPYMYYAMWQYALITDNPPQTAEFILANGVRHDGSLKLISAPTDELLLKYPFSHNAHIAGRIGWLELEQLAERTETKSVRDELNRLINLRITSFTKNSPYNHALGGTDLYCSTLNIARNFLFLTPELAQYLNENIKDQVQTAINEYEFVAPYWFVGEFESTTGEGTFKPYYDPIALFQTKARILKQSREELMKYLDAPLYPRGDLFYIQNLVAAIEAPSSSDFNPDLNSDSFIDFTDYSLFLPSFDSLFSIFDFNRLVSWFGSIF